MMYVSISDATVEIIKTKRTLFGERIVASSYGLLPEGLVKQGALVDIPGLARYIQSLCAAAYPSSIIDQQLVVALPDDAVLFERFSIPISGQLEDEMQHVLSTAKNKAAHHPETYENYYKVLADTPDAHLVFYTAIEKTALASCARLAQELGMELTYTTSRIFSLYELLYELITDTHVVVCIVMHTHSVEYLMMDTYGPMAYAHQHHGAKHVGVKDISTVISALTDQQSLAISGVIVIGEAVTGDIVQDLKEKLPMPVQELQEGMSTLLKRLKISHDFGGVNTSFFAFPLGLFRGKKRGDAPNLMLDDMSPLESPSEQDMFTLVEKRSSRVPFFLFVMCVLLGVCVVIYLFVRGDNKKVSFSSLPYVGTYLATPTPTVTLTPTLTPTPTKNPNLKRSDISVSVQNGTTKTGYAKQIADELEKKGYKDIKKSNADTTDYEQTVVKIKPEKSEYRDIVVEDITSLISAPKEEPLDASSSEDVLIILGKK